MSRILAFSVIVLSSMSALNTEAVAQYYNPAPAPQSHPHQPGGLGVDIGLRNGGFNPNVGFGIGQVGAGVGSGFGSYGIGQGLNIGIGPLGMTANSGLGRNGLGVSDVSAYGTDLGLH